MRSGRLRHRLVLQSKTRTQDAYGEGVVSWQTVDTVWGAIEPLSGREYFAQQAVQSEAQVRIVIRYFSGVDTTYRVSHGGKYYNIISVIDENTRGRELILMCRQGVSDDSGEDTTFYVTNSGVNVTNSGIQVTYTP